MQLSEIATPELPQELHSEEEPDSQPATPPQELDDAILQRLATLPRSAYERERKAAAKTLGYRTSTLDKLVDALRPKSRDAQNTSVLQGKELDVEDIELWPESVNAGEVLNELAETFSRYVALPDGAADALALWCAHTHVFDIFDCSPRLNISSPDKRCGKTTLREVISLFVPRPVLAENLTVAVLFRLIESKKPTVLADECDSWLRDNEELRGMLNSGHRRTGKAYRCQGEGHAIRAFDVFAPVVLCGIGALTGTLHDRSIVITLKRAKLGELRQRFDSRRTQDEQELCRKLARFCFDNCAALEACDPVLPPGLFNRLADNWRPLFAIADVAGGDWPQRVAVAFTKLTSNDDIDAQGVGVMLLADIRQVFSDAKTERIFSKVLVATLCAMTDRPWPEARNGHSISEVWLANHLKNFCIKPKTLRIGPKQRAKGYELVDFIEAFERYLPAPEISSRDIVTGQQKMASDEFTTRDNKESCHVIEEHESVENIDVSRCHASCSTTASVPFMITRKMENELRSLGYSADEINKLTPWQAGAILKRRQRSGNATRSVPIIHGDGWVAVEGVGEVRNYANLRTK